MIRLVQRRLIVPRGDTGTFSIPTLAGKDSGDAAIFTVFDPLMHRKIFEKEMSSSDGALRVDFTHNDTVNLPVGQYVWDIKFYTDPLIVDGKLVGGTEVDSYYSAFTLPICEIRETGDNLLMSDDAPTGALRPGQVDIITASIREITSLKESAAESAAEADTSATNAESSASAAAISAQDALDSKVAALAAQQTASAASENAASAAANAQASATLAAQRADQVMVELGTKANIEDLAAVAFSGLYSDLSGVPTQVSQFINDAGYLTQHQDISGKANIADLAAVATSGSYNDLSNKPTIPDVQINGNSIVDNGVANIPLASFETTGVMRAGLGLRIDSGTVSVLGADNNKIKEGTTRYAYIDARRAYSTAFYGLAKAAGDSTQSISTNAVGTYTNEAKEAIQTMLDVPSKADVPTKVSDLTDDSGHYTKPAGGIPASDLAETYLTQHQDISGKADKSEIPTLVSELTNDAGYITGYTETDPTVPAWAKAAQKPTYTAAEVGAPTVQEMNTAIGTAIGNINSFDMAVVQALPTEDISTHTIYLVPKTGETNDVYDEYVYINNAWEMIGNTQIDLSNYVQKTDYATNSTAGIVKVNDETGADGIAITASHKIILSKATNEEIKAGTNNYKPIVSSNEDKAAFYGLAKAAGDTTQSVSTNAVGTYTNEAKEAIQQMLDVPSKSDVQNLISVSTTAPSGDDAKIWIDTDDSTTVQVPTVAEMNLALAEKADIEDIPEVPVEDVQVNGSSILNNGIANIPIAVNGQYGLIRPYSAYGVGISVNGYLSINAAASSVIKAGENSNYPLVPYHQHESTFYGLAKAAGDTTQSISTNAIGTYTDSAKIAIKNMLGVTQTLTVTVLTQDNVTVTGQTVTVRAVNATGHVFATAAYEGQPVSFAVPSGFAYYVSVSDTLAHHFNPTTASGVITDADASVTLTYSDFSSIQTAADIKAALNAGLDLTDLVGEQISCTWNNSTLVWDVVDYSNDTITLLTHDTLPTQLVFEPAQALMWCENGLATGSYSFIDGSSTYYFTLTTAIPSGGQLRATTSAFQTYASMEATATLEAGTVSTTEISGATSLGTTASGNLNHMSRVNYGSNNYKESALFQWLNSTEAANIPVPRITKFSRPCTYSVPGFLGALDSSFVAAIDDTTWFCSTNNTYECPTSLGGTVAKSNAYTVTAKVGLASEMEIFGSYGGTADGSAVFDLFNGATADDRKKYQPGTSTARYWWLRSPRWSYASHERSVYSSGAAGYNGAYNSYGVVPAVKISKTVVSE